MCWNKRTRRRHRANRDWRGEKRWREGKNMNGKVRRDWRRPLPTGRPVRVDRWAEQIEKEELRPRSMKEDRRRRRQQKKREWEERADEEEEGRDKEQEGRVRLQTTPPLRPLHLGDTSGRGRIINTPPATLKIREETREGSDVSPSQTLSVLISH